MTLPMLNIVPTPEWQRTRLAKWLREWKVARRLAGEETSPDGAFTPWGRQDDDEGRAPPDRPEVKTGDIRLLAPCSPTAWRQPIYVVVLDVSVSDGTGLAAPFSPYAEPAVPGELLLRREPAGLRVVCLWNARELRLSILEDGWPADRLTDTELRHVRAVHGHTTARTPLPPALVRRVGPPLVHPLDPRWEYLEEQTSFMTRLVRESVGEVTPLAGDASDQPVPDVLTLYGTPADGEAAGLQRAADGRKGYGMPVRRRLANSELLLELIPGHGHVAGELRVLDADGHPCGRLDGAMVRTPSGHTAGPLTNGTAAIPADWTLDGLTIVHDDGTHLELERTDHTPPPAGE